MSKYEIELRGRLNRKQRDKLLNLLKKKGKFVKRYNRTHWCFSLSYKKGVDLRIKETNGKPEFSLKVGQLQKTNRKEISIPISKNKLSQAFEFLKYLGYNQGIKAIRNAEIYKYLSIEWAIVEVPNHSWYFEAEKLVKNKKDGKLAEEQIKKICQKLGLTTLSEKETIEYIKILDREANDTFKI